MQGSFKPPAGEEARRALSQLAQSGDARRLAALVQRSGGAQAAQAAAKGSPEQLMGLVSQLMGTKEGAELVERIESQAKKEGLR